MHTVSTIPAVAPPESVVVEIWERQLFATHGLDALGLAVVHRGTPSDCGGPDYRDVVLAVDQRRLQHGDVEFHSRSSDWYTHGHHRDPHYNAVVLHVVWTDDGRATVNQADETVPVLALSSCPLSSDATARTPPFALAPYRCASRLAGLPAEDMWERIRMLGRQRVRARSERMAEEIEDVGADQALYGNLLEGLGFAGNREGFRLLAEALPLAWLFGIPPHERTNVLLAAGGFASPTTIRPPSRLRADTWRLSCLRPGNHPVQRIPAIALLLERFGSHFARQAATRAMEAARAVDLTNVLVVRTEHATPIGPGRAREMVASSLLPFAYALTGDERIFAQLDQIPAPPPTRWTRAFAGLLPEPLRVASATEHQGIHELYVQHCRWERAASCPVCDDVRA